MLHFLYSNDQIRIFWFEVKDIDVQIKDNQTLSILIN